MKNAFLNCLIIFILSAASASSACAQAMLAFSGGNNTPMTLTLGASVTYVVTAAPVGKSPFFDFQVAAPTFTSQFPVSGTMTYTINGGASQTFTSLGSDPAGDYILASGLPGVTVGSTVVLNAGTLTTTTIFNNAPPANASYATFLTDGSNNKLDAANGISVPEPGPVAIIVSMGLVTIYCRTRRLTTRSSEPQLRSGR